MCDPAKISCDPGFYCSKTLRACRPQLELGDYCSDYEGNSYQGSNWNVICKGGLKCSGPPENEYCISWKTGLKGTPCNYDMDGDDTCRFGLTCSRRRRICVDIGEDIVTWRCNGSPTNCTYEKEEMCVCNNGPIGSCQRVFELYTPRCDFDAASNRYRNCISQNNCAFEPNALTAMELNALDPETCIGKFCANGVLSAVCCGYEKYVNVLYSPANMPPFCTYQNAPLAVFLVLFFLCLGSIFLIGVVAIVVGLVYYFIKGRKSQGLSSAIFSTNKEGDFQSLD